LKRQRDKSTSLTICRLLWENHCCSLDGHYWETKPIVAFEPCMIEFSPLYVFYSIFHEEYNDILAFDVAQLLFFDKKLTGGGGHIQKNFLGE